MLNSLTVFLAALGFALFGYLSLVRLVSKNKFGDANFKQLLSAVKTSSLLSNLGSSAFFVSLPATSLLLFWGWGPALLWLIIFHLIVETICHLQFSLQSGKLSVADHLLRSDKAFTAALEQGLIQAFFLLSMGLVTALLATLIDRQSGLLFAILFLLPARALLRHSSSALPLALKTVGAIALLGLGLALSNQLGFSLYGDWAPFGDSISWLRFNNPTIIASVLIVAVFQLEKNAGFKTDLSSFAGVIIVLLVLAMMAQLAWSQPIVDAPINSVQVASETLPKFIFLNLFVFSGFAALLIGLLNEENNLEGNQENNIAQSQNPKAITFGRLQSGSFIHLSFMVLLALSLAAALGIGAWKTHYIVWDDSLNILDQLNLAISSILHLISAQKGTGTLLHTILLAALCFTGFSFMLNGAHQLTLEEREKETIFSLILESKILQAILIFVSACYFISEGFSIEIWLVIGILAWILTTHLILGMSLSDDKPSVQRSLLTAIGLISVIVGSAQLIYFVVHWALSTQYFYSGCVALLFLISALLWWRTIPTLLKNFGQNSNADLF